MKFWAGLCKTRLSGTGITDNEWFPYPAVGGQEPMFKGGRAPTRR